MHNPLPKRHILIAGLGDLGTGLAQALQADGHRLSAIRRRPHAPAGVDLYPQDLVTAPVILLPPARVDLLVIVLTPAGRNETGYRQSFLVAPQRLLEALAKQQPVPPAIFVSSTAVFGDIDGPVDEDTPPAPDSFNGKILLAAEAALSRNRSASCVRLAGIYGRSDFRRRRAIAMAKGDAPLPAVRWMNRIHRDDCVGLLHSLANRWLTEGYAPPLVIGCDNRPISNHQLYRRLADEEGLSITLPEKRPPGGKRIHSRFIAEGHYRIQAS